jgi:hypothetical protein
MAVPLMDVAAGPMIPYAGMAAGPPGSPVTVRREFRE